MMIPWWLALVALFMGMLVGLTLGAVAASAGDADDEIEAMIQRAKLKAGGAVGTHMPAAPDVTPV